jgi:CDP-diacylglycerol---glycerol-3-phosphate 3-phosphatidyltransferase
MANLISLLRVLLAFGTVSLLFYNVQSFYLAAFVLTIVVIWMDGLDGYVARKLNEASKIGAVIDILGDRVVEIVYWMTFLALGWLPLWIPLLVTVRGVLVDGFRALALEQGYTAFGSTTMMQSKIGVFLVSSRASRWLYAVFKALVFALLILIHTPGLQLPDALTVITNVSVYITVFFCVVRGLPVLIESRRFFKSNGTTE